MSGYANSILGGMSNLIRAAIQSPNFVTGLTGWRINKDGSAEFNSLTLRGTLFGTNYVINSDGAFFYNGTPGLGNPPIAWMTTVTADSFGNPVVPGLGATEGALTAAVTGSLGAILNSNPFFSGGSSTGWNGFNGTVTPLPNASLPVGAPYPFYGLQYINNGVTAGAAEESSDKFTIVPGNTYIVTAWVYSTTTTVSIGFDWTLNGAFVSSATTNVTVPANTWTLIQAIKTAPGAGVNQAYPRVGCVTAGLGSTTYMQAVQVFPQVQGIVDATTITGAVINGGVFNGTNWIQNSSGTFFYSGTPAAGNLIASIASAGGADSFGNNYGAGIFAYGSSTISGINNFSAIQGNSVLIQNGSFPYQINVDATSGMLSFGVPHGGVFGFFDGSVFNAAQPGTSTPEVWHTLAPVNGWANQGGGLAKLQYKKLITNEVWLIGVLNPAAFTSTTIATLPADYRPTGAAIEDSFEFHTAAGAGSGCFLRIGTGGTIQAINGVTTMGAVGINTRIPLDTIT